MHEAELQHACVIVPAYDAAATLGDVISGLRRELPNVDIIVVDDGSTDATSDVARAHDVALVRLETNRGKGAALRAGFEEARTRGKRVALTVDADGQHPTDEAKRVLEASDDEGTFVLGVRDLERDGAPKANRFSNGISNYFLSRFAGRVLRDTQCGLRRYPIAKTLALRTHGRGYDFEAEVLLRAIWSGMNVIELPVRVHYPVDRVTHFHVARDPWRIIRTIVATVGEQWLRPASDSAEPAADEAQ